MTGLATALAAYASTRVAQSSWRSRAAFEVWQRRQLYAWLHASARRVPFYAPFPADLAAFPIIDKKTVMENFEAFNVAGITAAQGWQAFEGSRRIGDYVVGASSGTSGNRGLFVISERERFLWLGTILAKALPDFWYRGDRIAVILPMHTPLYESANETRRLQLKFFDLMQPLEGWLGTLTQFLPTVLIAPPKILRHLAERQVAITPRKIFSAAETLDSIDRAAITAHFTGQFGEIYMATEGLLGVTCAQGAMHLAEDCNHFEFDTVAGHSGLVSPLITNFRRTTQIMARYRMNDLLRLSDAPCACGSPLRVVREIAGRMDDVFELAGAAGLVFLTPDILRNTVLDADRSIDDFRLSRLAKDQVLLLLPDDLDAAAADRARTALETLFWRHGASAGIIVRQEHLPLEPGRKLRRVESLPSKAAA